MQDSISNVDGGEEMLTWNRLDRTDVDLGLEQSSDAARLILAHYADKPSSVDDCEELLPSGD